MRFSINIPNFGDFADPRTVASLAATAEEAGWDGFFVWDHVAHTKRARRPHGDPWMLLTAAALATTRIRLGTLVTPVPRRRPHQLARQVATLDNLSGGRVIFGAGLGGPIADEYASFGEPTDPVVLAERLDEGLDLLELYWSGDAITHLGRHYEANDVALLPTPVQRPRPPIWIGGFWPARRPMRRAARWDGAAPLFTSARHGEAPPPAEVREVTDYIRRHRTHQPDAPFEVVVGGVSPTEPAQARDLLGPLVDAGATWWDERRRQDDRVDQLEPVRRRVEQGPPRVD
ncbi:LLM class flavin-dependent oxidoreductase [Actinopolymorpha pittospori]|uniref:Alkanesulfonate monooxygenase SsuD/methylene tetrahydromethanopterin reductase-like flavin-dependent oxidoreductase (Luciferase family) n=1 Tax=Actinopolymorpha pittospori TaxID=648752 RepID=A0A927MZC0_9ACTN|nr:LLM class flavin-dependent oxidoreductase [Actinopolymorpha pittospori]MBE1608962.1 alkanesulfonate monooxygenase SsuD/methylene tetrahydromethanopterin reductase-like flavin-dependent oxidoreductase (luciferase family) [Actinopolymorpha pittospori]